jgi:anti-sigma-K factor RskA
VTDEPASCRSADDAGAWVLGALAEPEGQAFAEHLEICAECRRDVAELRVPAGLLGLAAPPVAPAPELRERIMAVVRAEAELLAAAGPEADRVSAAPSARRPWWTRRPALAGAGALAAAACAAVLALTVFGNDPEHARTLTGTASGGARMVVRVDGGHAVLRLAGMPAPPAGRVYEVWIVRHGVPQATHALFGVRADGRAQIEVPEKVSGAERVMITDEPQGGSVMPTGRVVANTDLA